MKKSLIAATGLVFVITLSGCGMGGLLNQDAPEGVSNGSRSDVSSREGTSDIGGLTLGLNPLTGDYDILPGESKRPVCVMIGNNDRSRPQCGLDGADMYVEAETEGGITRIMAVFSGVTRVPEKLGPVRSARSPFVLIAQSLGAVYCHAGGSTAGTATIQKTGVNDVNALVASGSTAFWRDAALKKSHGMEYSMMTSGEKLASRIQALKYSTDYQKSTLFCYASEPAGSGAGNTLQVVLSGIQTDSFVYHADEKVYYKFNGTLSGGTPHETMEGRPVTAANILVLYDTKYNENEQTIGFKLNAGEGWLVSGGTSGAIRWSRTASGLKFTDESGADLRFMTGKTYLCLISSAYKSRIQVS